MCLFRLDVDMVGSVILLVSGSEEQERQVCLWLIDQSPRLITRRICRQLISKLCR
jgi:hypothetical protein